MRNRVLRGFLVDGAIIPGSSGSPVVIKPATIRYVRGQMVMQTFLRVLLGIIAETRYAPIITHEADFLSFAGLGLAFNADTIQESRIIFKRILTDNKTWKNLTLEKFVICHMCSKLYQVRNSYIRFYKIL